MFLSNGFAFLFLVLIVLATVLFIQFVVAETPARMRRFALTIVTQSITMMAQTIALRVVHILTEKEIENSTHCSVDITGSGDAAERITCLACYCPA